MHGFFVYTTPTAKTPYIIGLENIQHPLWKTMRSTTKKIGLITNQTGRNSAGKRTVDVLRERGLTVTYMFAPEHGIAGTVKAEKEVFDTVDAATAIPIISLYGKGTGKELTHKALADVDLLLFDMQDCGMRHYTYISTLFACMQLASSHDIPFVVLDRPNPLGGAMNGPLCDPKQTKSFIAAAAIPLRHGMTVGELAQYYNDYGMEKKVQLSVIPMQSYERTMPLDATLFTPLSPNIQTMNSCYGYSFLGLLGEVRPFDCGLGSEHAMHCLGLAADSSFSKTDWRALQKIIAECGLSSKLIEYYSPRKKKMYRGLRFMFNDINTVASYDILINTLTFFNSKGIPLTFSRYFDVAIGTPLVREYVQGNVSKKKLDAYVAQQLAQFHKQAASAYLYKPWPKV